MTLTRRFCFVVFFSQFLLCVVAGWRRRSRQEFYSQVTRHRQLANSFSAVVDTHNF